MMRPGSRARFHCVVGDEGICCKMLVCNWLLSIRKLILLTTTKLCTGIYFIRIAVLLAHVHLNRQYFQRRPLALVSKPPRRCRDFRFCQQHAIVRKMYKPQKPVTGLSQSVYIMTLYSNRFATSCSYIIPSLLSMGIHQSANGPRSI